MAHIKHRVGIKAGMRNVFEALATTKGISGWWTETTSGNSTPGGIVENQFFDKAGAHLGSMRFEIINLETDTKVHWLFLDGPKEWIGSEVIFELKQEDDYTIVLFSQIKWAEEVEFMSYCSMKWAIFLLSLKQLVEDGKGSPSPGDVKIDDWN